MGNQNQDKFSQTNAADTDTAATEGATENQKTCCLGQWMKCLRKPALSMQYTLEKRHIPDMDNDPTGQTAGKGSNSDTMSVTGGFTIRYFDLAAGAMTLLLTGCMIKALCCVKKMM